MRITKPFYLGKYLVTQEQWEAVMGNNPSNFKGPKNPVEKVSWDDCQEFLEQAQCEDSAARAGKFRLPTEAQWEYACRAGARRSIASATTSRGWANTRGTTTNSGSKTHPVGEKKPNAWGLYDMHGNVWEWCQDWYDGGYYAKSPTDDPAGPATGSDRVDRGGGWNAAPGAAGRRTATATGRGPLLQPGLPCLPSSGGQVRRANGAGARPERSPEAQPGQAGQARRSEESGKVFPRVQGVALADFVMQGVKIGNLTKCSSSCFPFRPRAMRNRRRS